MKLRAANRRWSCPRLEALEERRLLTAVVGQHIFYNGSSFDGNDTAANAADDGAIAPDKSPFLSQVLYDPEQLTTNLTFDSEVRVYGEKLVWQGRGGTDGGTDDEIFYYDGTTVVQLTENAVPDRMPEISAMGLVWERGSGTTQEIIFWNGTETQLTTNTVLDSVSSLSDNRVSWQGGAGTAIEIFSWDGVNPPANISLNDVVDVLPYANGNNTVWVTDSVPNRKVLKHDGTSITIIGASDFSIEDPRLDGIDAAWESFKGSMTTDREIYYYNGTIVQRISNNSFSDFDPQVSDGHVTWWGGVFNDFQIYLFDGTTTREISTGIRNQFPQIDGQYIVWQGFDGNDDEIFLWDGVKVTQLTDNALANTAPRISGKHIAWLQSIPSNGNSQEILHTYIDQEQATPDNVTSYSRGINGIMIDLVDLPPETVLTADDFHFRTGNNNSPATWTDATTPASITVRAGAGEGGSDRVTITWANGVLRNTWLQVTVEGNDGAGGFNTNTGLATSEIFYWGNKVGDSFTGTGDDTFNTTSTDAAQVFASVGTGRPITDLRDFNRDGQVNSTDAAIVFANVGLLARLDFDGVEAPPAALQSAVPANEAGPLNTSANDPQLAFALATTARANTPVNDVAAEQSLRVNRASESTLGRLRQLADWARSVRESISDPADDGLENPLHDLADDLLDLLARRRHRRT